MQWRASKRQCTGHCEAASRRCQCGPAPGFCVFGCCPPASRRTAAGAADGAAGRWQARSGGGRHFRRRRSCFWCAETGSGCGWVRVEKTGNSRYHPPSRGREAGGHSECRRGETSRRSRSGVEAWRRRCESVLLGCVPPVGMCPCGARGSRSHAIHSAAVVLYARRTR
jgi:hypothetical protein